MLFPDLSLAGGTRPSERAADDAGSANLVGALRRTMALTGYATTKELQKAELVVAG